MKIYKVAVTEVYRKVVSVQAKNETEAHQRAWDAWKNTEIILGMDDFEGAEMSVISECQENDNGPFVEGYDYGKGATKNGR